MADYKVIHKAQGAEIAWEPGCPVVVTALQVSRSTRTSECWLQAKARNVSGADAASIFAAASITYADGSSEELPVEFLDADVAAGSEQNLRPRSLPRGDVRTCTLAVTRVEAQGETWESAGEALPLPKREKLALSARAAAQRAINLGIGPETPAVRGKVRDHGDWWACACGQVNVRRDSCCECCLAKAALVANEDEAALLADADERDDEIYAEAVRLQELGTVESLAKAIEKFESLGTHKGANELIAQCEEKITELKSIKVARRKALTRRSLIGIAGIAVAAGGIALFVNVIEPSQKRQKAEQALASGNFKKAEDLYLEIGDDEAYRHAFAIHSETDGDTALANGDYATAVDKYVDAGANDKADKARYAYVTENRNATDELTFTYLGILKGNAYKDSAAIYDELFGWSFEFAFVFIDWSNHDDVAKCEVFDTALAGKWLGDWPDSDVASWERVIGFNKHKSCLLLFRAIAGPPDGSKCSLRVNTKERYAEHWNTSSKYRTEKPGEWDEHDQYISNYVAADGTPYFVSIGSDSLYDAFSVTVEDEDGTLLFEKTLEAH